mmetsp:Transcript_6130/g.38080  ORF Transcript_6130/g.38080 Transcript_6130/m.38080 type:complete len:86 (-) Transcript_6130:4096-4353(-)
MKQLTTRAGIGTWMLPLLNNKLKSCTITWNDPAYLYRKQYKSVVKTSVRDDKVFLQLGLKAQVYSRHLHHIVLPGKEGMFLVSER